MSTDLARESLESLAERIRQEHQTALLAAQDALEHAFRCGKLLLEAKRQLQHGEFTPWVDENCEFSHRIANQYMLIARTTLDPRDILDKSSTNSIASYLRAIEGPTVSDEPSITETLVKVEESFHFDEPSENDPADKSLPVEVKTQGTVARRKGKTKVNGKEVTEEPPDVAAARENGTIPEHADVTITEPETHEDPEAELEAAEERKAIQEEISDETWLANLPLSQLLTDDPLRVFQGGAMIWKELQKARKQYANAVAGVIGPKRNRRTRDEYSYRVQSFLAIEPPERWHLCGSPENGGCNGTGQILIGQCPKCHGRGYWIM